MLKLRSYSLTIALGQNGKQYCILTVDAVDDVNPNLNQVTAEEFEVGSDTSVQSLMIEVNTLVISHKSKNGVS